VHAPPGPRCPASTTNRYTEMSDEKSVLRRGEVETGEDVRVEIEIGLRGDVGRLLGLDLRDQVLGKPVDANKRWQLSQLLSGSASTGQ